MLDPDKLDPGIRRTVLWLNDRGFRTTDSGDGVTKNQDDHYPCALPVPHVFMYVAPDRMVADSHLLLDALVAAGLDPGESVVVSGQEMPAWSVETSYDPSNRYASLHLFGVNDAKLFPNPVDTVVFGKARAEGKSEELLPVVLDSSKAPAEWQPYASHVKGNLRE